MCFLFLILNVARNDKAILKTLWEVDYKQVLHVQIEEYES